MIDTRGMWISSVSGAWRPRAPYTPPPTERPILSSSCARGGGFAVPADCSRPSPATARRKYKPHAKYPSASKSRVAHKQKLDWIRTRISLSAAPTRIVGQHKRLQTYPTHLSGMKSIPTAPRNGIHIVTRLTRRRCRSSTANHLCSQTI